MNLSTSFIKNLAGSDGLAKQICSPHVIPLQARSDWFPAPAPASDWLAGAAMTRACPLVP